MTYDGVPDHIGPLLLGLFLDHRGDLEAAWREITAPEHGWVSFLAEARADARWASGGTHDRVVTHDNSDYAMDTAFWFLLDFSERVLTVRRDGVLAALSIDAEGVAVAKEGTQPWCRRRRSYGEEDPDSVLNTLLPELEALLNFDGNTFSLQVVDPMREDPWGMIVPARMVTWSTDEAEGTRQIVGISEWDARIAPWRAFRDPERLGAYVRGVRDGMEDCARRGVVPSSYVHDGLWPWQTLDLELTGAEQQEIAARRVIAHLEI